MITVAGMSRSMSLICSDRSTPDTQKSKTSITQSFFKLGTWDFFIEVDIKSAPMITVAGMSRSMSLFCSDRSAPETQKYMDKTPQDKQTISYVNKTVVC